MAEPSLGAQPPPKEALHIQHDEGELAATGATFVLAAETHTLGNSLRHELAQAPDVAFVGYSIPHPSESALHVRVQTRNGVTPAAAVVGALSSLSARAKDIGDAYAAAVMEFDVEAESQMQS